jgi:adenosylmethionine-8-amino-7-oxononanoate aminotransferase
MVEEIRAGTGVLAAVQLSAEALADDSTLPARAVRACREAGVMTRALGTGGLQVSPALVIDQSELKELSDGIGAALDSLT